jgi:hypothetical protein
MVNGPDGDQFHFNPATYLEMIREELPAYDELQDAVAEATAGIHGRAGARARRRQGTDVPAAARLRPRRVGARRAPPRRCREANLFAHVADRVRPGGRFVLGGVYDQPSTTDDQVQWLAAAGLHAEVVWARQDLVVIVADGQRI